MAETEQPTCKCGARMVSRRGPSGQFWGCSRYPECRLTRHATARKTLFDPKPAPGLAEADANWRATLASAGVVTGDVYEQEQKKRPTRKRKPQPEPAEDQVSESPQPATDHAVLMMRMDRIETAIGGIRSLLTEILRMVSVRRDEQQPTERPAVAEPEIGELPPTGEPAPDDEIPF